MLIEVPTKNVLFMFTNTISFLINEQFPKSKIELYNYLDNQFNINDNWKKANRFESVVTKGRVVTAFVKKD
jgi:hypothetical protein